MGACATKPKALDGPVPEDKLIESTATTTTTTTTTSDVSAPVEATTTSEVVADSKEVKEEPQVDLSEPKHEETGKAATVMDEPKEDELSTENVCGTHQEQNEEKTNVKEKVDDYAKTEEKPSTST